MQRSVVDRRPALIGLYAILLISTSGTALGVVPLPGSLRESPDLYGQTTAILMSVGALVGVIGMLWRGKDSRDALIIEQFGIGSLGLGMVLYAVALMLVPKPSDAILAIAVCVGMSTLMAIQWALIFRFLRRIRRRLEEQSTATQDGDS